MPKKSRKAKFVPKLTTQIETLFENQKIIVESQQRLIDAVTRLEIFVFSTVKRLKDIDGCTMEQLSSYMDVLKSFGELSDYWDCDIAEELAKLQAAAVDYEACEPAEPAGDTEEDQDTDEELEA